MAGGLLREEDMPDDIRELKMKLPQHERHIVMPCDGDSAIIGPDGNYLAGPVLNEEVILTATGNTGTVMFQKMIADHAGHYTRPDVFEFKVNRRPKRTVTFEEREEDVRVIRRAIVEGDVRSQTDLLGALDDLNIDLESVRGER
jgi:hypothetical protein